MPKLRNTKGMKHNLCTKVIKHKRTKLYQNKENRKIITHKRNELTYNLYQNLKTQKL